MPTSIDASAQLQLSIHVEKEYHKFSAAHFLIFEDGSAERLHGHNYRVSVDIGTARESHGMVVDFRQIKPRISAIVDRLDERLIVPGRHPELTCEPFADGEVVVRHRQRRYIVPTDDVVLLPISNTSSENLARWIAEQLLASVITDFPDLQLTSLEVSVEETPGQRGIARLAF